MVLFYIVFHYPSKNMLKIHYICKNYITFYINVSTFKLYFDKKEKCFLELLILMENCF